MKNLITRRLNNIQSLEERKIFRDILNQVFADLVDYQDRQIENLKKNFYDELTRDSSRPVICGTIIKQYEYDVTDDFMFPMIKEDVNGYLPAASELKRSLNEGKPYMLGKTFLKCDYLTLQDLYHSRRSFPCRIYTESGCINVSVKLAKYDTYNKLVEHLYSVFVKNGMEWTTPNLPYIQKFTAFMLEKQVELEEDTVIEKIEVDLEEYETLREDDVFPVWNLEYTNIQSINFPIPTFDNVLKEHRFDVYDLPEYCYLPDFKYEYSGYVKRKTEQVSIIIPEADISEWPMYKLHPRALSKNNVYVNEIYSNEPSDNFSNGYLNVKQKSIRTKGEMIRILSSFKCSDEFRIRDCEIIERNCRYKNCTYPVNEGIIDEIRTADIKNRTLVVHLDYKSERNYLSDDLASFLVSELQQYIPDMKCIGVIGREEKK